MALRPAVFLDRDGVLNVQLVRDGMPYAPEKLEDFRLYEGAAAACRDLKTAGFSLVVATNQPDVGRGRGRTGRDRGDARAPASADPGDRPGRGELRPRAAARIPRGASRVPECCWTPTKALGLDLARSWMVGDRWRDVECGKRAGVKTVFIDYGYSDEHDTHPDYTVHTLHEAVAIILRTAAGPGKGS